MYDHLIGRGTPIARQTIHIDSPITMISVTSVSQAAAMNPYSGTSARLVATLKTSAPTAIARKRFCSR